MHRCYYDPSIGRFQQEDALRASLTAPPSLNLYPYVANNPINAIDPSGRILIPPQLAAAAVGAAIGGVVGGIQAAMNGENIAVGVIAGVATGALAGVTLSPVVSLAVGAVAGVGGNVASQIANDIIAGTPIDVDVVSAIVSGGAGAIGVGAALQITGIVKQAVLGGIVTGIVDILGQLGLNAVRDEAGLAVKPSGQVLRTGICPIILRQ